MEKPGEKIFDEIKKLFLTVNQNGAEFYEKGNKSAGRRARKALDEIAKLKVQWRKETV